MRLTSCVILIIIGLAINCNAYIRAVKRLPSSPVKFQHSWQPEELLTKDYNKLQPPPTYEGEPLEVKVSLNISQIFGVNEADQTIKLRATLLERWTDDRIKYPAAESMSKISLTAFKDRLWLATTFFAGAIEAKPNDNAPLLVVVTKDQEVRMTRRLVTKITCEMDLTYFPHDTQTCEIILESCKCKLLYLQIVANRNSVSDSNSRVNYTWDNFSVIHHESAKLRVTGSTYNSCESTRGPEYSCLRASFTVVRRLPYYLIRVYGPSFMIVMTNFMGFWLPVQGLPARTLLIVLPLLALVTQQTTIYAEIVVSYVVALHIWFIVCELFIFMALFELAFALIYCRRVDEKNEAEKLGVTLRDMEAHKAHKRKISTPQGPNNLLDVHDLERQLGLGKKFKYELTKPDSHDENAPASPNLSERVYSGHRNSLTPSHMIKTALNQIYGNVDWRKSPQDRNKVDYVSRILFPVMFFLFVALYAITLH